MGNESAAAAAEPDPNADVKPGLSDEEKAALAAEDDADLAGAGDDGTGKSVEPPQAAGDAKPDDAGAGASDNDAAAAAAAAAIPEPPPEIPRGREAKTELTTSHAIDAELSAARLKDIDAEIVALDAKFEASEIEAKDYMAQTRVLSTEQGDLKADLRELAMVQGANSQIATGDWNKSIDRFLQENSDFDEPIMSGALNAALGTLYSDKDNTGASHNWYLQTAARAVRERISPVQAALDAPPDGDAAAAANDPNAKAVAAAKAVADKAAGKKDALPKTLGDAPAAHEADTSQDQFAALDGLSGMELEAKLANLSPDQEAAYLRAQ